MMMLATVDQAAAAAAAHATDRYLAVDGARLRYRDDGRGPAVLLMHGWTFDLEMWGPQVASLRTPFRLVRFDRRGFGLSSGHPSLANDVSDIDSMCRCLGLGCVALVGMSQGARAALEFAAVAAKRVACIVLDGPPDMDTNAATEEDVPLAHYRELLREKGIRAFRREWALHSLVQLRTTDPGSRRLLDSMIERYPGTDLLEGPGTADVSFGPPLLESVATPALIISGEHDLPSRLDAAQRLARRLPHAEHAVIPDAGHLPNIDNPDAYNLVASTFIKRHVAAAT